jgi:Protein of unknown function (DUF3800)
MAFYSAHFDESGDPDASDYLVVAGAVADVDQWGHLEREWRPLVERLGQSVFHRCDIDQSKPNSQEILLRLSQIIRRRVERAFAIVVPLKEYRAINRQLLLAEVVGFPYPLAARFCISDVARWAKYHDVVNPILNVFERGAKHQGQLEWIACRDKFPVPDYKTKDLVPLQAADLIAGEVAAHVPQAKKRDAFQPGPCFEEIAHTLKDSWYEIKVHLLPNLFEVPRRDPQLRYRSKIVTIRGERRALVHCWPKAQGNSPRVKKALMQIPPQPIITPEQGRERLLPIKDADPDDVMLQLGIPI